MSERIEKSRRSRQPNTVATSALALSIPELHNPHYIQRDGKTFIIINSISELLESDVTA
jgi:hypothetical protein